jgi:hypothetical protein
MDDAAVARATIGLSHFHGVRCSRLVVATLALSRRIVVSLTSASTPG